MAAIGNATKHGFLVREGDALERLAGVKKITFDKTGTLTYGTPKVTKVAALPGYTEEEVYAYAAAVETLSEHPLGKTIAGGYAKAIEPAKDFKMIPGEGVTGTVDGKEIKAGNLKLLFANGDAAMEERRPPKRRRTSAPVPR